MDPLWRYFLRHRPSVLVQVLGRAAVDNEARSPSEGVVGKAGRRGSRERRKLVARVPRIGVRTVVQKIAIRIVRKRLAVERCHLVGGIEGVTAYGLRHYDRRQTPALA